MNTLEDGTYYYCRANNYILYPGKAYLFTGVHSHLYTHDFEPLSENPCIGQRRSQQVFVKAKLLRRPISPTIPCYFNRSYHPLPHRLNCLVSASIVCALRSMKSSRHHITFRHKTARSHDACGQSHRIVQENSQSGCLAESRDWILSLEFPKSQ
jgi:hypothetical protein